MQGNAIQVVTGILESCEALAIFKKHAFFSSVCRLIKKLPVHELISKTQQSEIKIIVAK